jgi:transposase
VSRARYDSFFGLTSLSGLNVGRSWREEQRLDSYPQLKGRLTAILASLPGVGRIVLATLLAEAWDVLQRRDYTAQRSLTGVALVTKLSGKMRIVI